MWYNISHMKNKQKGFIVPLLSAFVVLLVIGGGYFYVKNKNIQNKEISKNTVSTTTNETNDTSDWKTYSNTEQNFQIEYPSEWVYTVTLNKGQSADSLTGQFFAINWGSSLGIGVWKNSALNDLLLKSPNVSSQKQTTTDLNGGGWKITETNESLVGDAGKGGLRVKYIIYNKNNNTDKVYTINCGVTTLPNFDLCQKTVKTFKIILQ